MNFGGTIRLNRVGVCIIVAVCVILFLYLNTYNRLRNTDDTKTDSEKKNYINLRRLLIAAIQVAEKGGQKVVDIRKEHDIKEKSKGKLVGGVKDPVTEADYQSHCVMYYGIVHTFPKLKVISEETLAEEECTHVPILDVDSNTGIHLPATTLNEYVPIEDVTVWIDPLDATKEYTEKLLHFVTTMVCVAIAGKPVIGVIHKPFMQEPNTYWAWVNKGQSEDLHPAKQVDNKLKVIVSLSHAGPAKNISERAFGKSVEVISAAGAGYKSLELVQGGASAYLHLTDIKKWDVCAGDAIIRAVGGKMTTLSNNEIEYLFNSDHVNKEGLLGSMDKHDWLLKQLNNAMKVKA